MHRTQKHNCSSDIPVTNAKASRILYIEMVLLAQGNELSCCGAILLNVQALVNVAGDYSRDFL